MSAQTEAERRDPPTDGRLIDLPSAESTTRGASGVDLHVVAAGDPDDPLVVLLHGFPEFWYAWRRQIPALVDAGFRVLAPDQRGYNLSDVPAGIDAYRLPALCADVATLIDSEGRDAAHVVGHDWGGIVAWELALRRPEVVDRLAILNAPHLDAYRRTLLRQPTQLLRSWYAAVFQLPRVPEWLLARDEFAALERATAGSARPGAFDDADLAAYRAAWREAGISGAVNWYRALARRRDPRRRDVVSQPTRICWGERDAALVPALAERSLAYCEDGDLQRFPDATHWLHLEEPRDVNRALVDHLSA